MKFTFKTHKATGRFRAFQSDSHDIKLKGKVVGAITDTKRSEDDKFKIRFMVKKGEKYNDNNTNCDWMWVQLKRKFETLDEAKEYLRENTEEIAKTLTLHYHED